MNNTITKTKTIKLTPKIIENRIKKEYPKGVELYYIDYRDRIEDEKMLENLAQTGYLNDDEFDILNFDAEWEAIDYIKKEIDKDNTFSITDKKKGYVSLLTGGEKEEGDDDIKV